MANVGTVTFDIAAEAAKLRSELDKVKKDVSGISSTAKGLERGLKTVGSAVIGAFSIGAITGFARHVTQAADRLQDMSQKLGVSASRLNVIELAATQAGASTEAVSTAMAKLTENVGAAAAGNKSAAAAISTLGLSTTELLKLRPDQTFEKITAALSGLPNEYQRASVAQDLFGKGAKELSGFYREGVSAIDAVQAALERHGAALSDLDIARIGVMNDDLALQGMIVDNLGIKMVSSFTPAVEIAIESVSSLTQAVGGATVAGRAMGVVFVGVVKAIETAGNLIMAVFEKLRSIVTTLWGAVLTGLEKLVGGFAFVAEKLGLDMAVSLRATEKGISGIADSIFAIAAVSGKNAVTAAMAAWQSATDILHAGEKFDEASRRLEERAEAAARRGSGGGAIAAGGEAAQSRILAEGGALRVEGGEGVSAGAIGGDEFAFEQMLQAQQDRITESLRQAGVGRVEAWRSSLEQMTGMTQLAADQQLAIEQAKAGNMSALALGLVGTTIAASGKLGKVQKSLSIASTIWNTGQAIMKAMAQVPWPANIGAAALAAAMGLRQIQSIRSTNFSASGTVSGGLAGAGGGGGSGGGLSDGTFGTPTGLAQQEPQRHAQIIIHGNVFSSQETARWLLDTIAEAVNDRDVVVISADSRQALELGGA